MFESVKANRYTSEVIALAESSAAEVCNLFAAITHGTILTDRDLATFEFSFYYFFVYDYKVFHKLSPRLRRAIGDNFVKRVFVPRRGNFSGLKATDEFFDNRMQAYTQFMEEAEKIGAFVSKAADYINVLVTRGVADNGYAYGRLLDLPQIRKGIEPDRYTDLIKQTLTLNSSLLLAIAETELVVLRTLCGEIMNYIMEVVSSIGVKKRVNMIELASFAMSIVTEVYTIAKRGVPETTPLLDRFHHDMTDFVVKEFFLKQNPNAGNEYACRLHDYFPELLLIRYPEYRAALKKDLKVNTMWRNTSDSLLQHLFTEPPTQDEKANLLIPLCLKIAQSYTWAMTSICFK